VTDYPPPSWGHIDAFCAADGWTQCRTTDHVHWEKVLPDGSVLKTHRSLASNKVIKPNRFHLILREQLQVSQKQFWEAINTGSPVERPVILDDAPPEYPAWVVWGLKKYGYTEDDVRKMTPEDAEALLQEKWSEPASG
jgi:hypothetical protein